MKDKVIVITGAASGIGLEAAKLLASKGAKVSLADVQEAALDQAVREINDAGGRAMGRVVDVRNRQQVEDWIKATTDTFGKLDGAANLAGVIGKAINITHLQDIDDDDWDFVVGVNQKGLLNCLRAQIPYLKDGSSIVNAASVAGIIGFPRNAAYVASKHAVVGLTRVAAKELGKRQIRCNCFCPWVSPHPFCPLPRTLRSYTLLSLYTKTNRNFFFASPVVLSIRPCFVSRPASVAARWTLAILPSAVRASLARLPIWSSGCSPTARPLSRAQYKTLTVAGCVRENENNNREKVLRVGKTKGVTSWEKK